jgi:ribosomal protein S11
MNNDQNTKVYRDECTHICKKKLGVKRGGMTNKEKKKDTPYVFQVAASMHRHTWSMRKDGHD